MKRVRWIVAGSCVMAVAAGAAPAGIHTTEMGRGPTVVIVHSMGGTRATWMPTARRLMAGHRVVMADLPGHGQSPLPDPFSLEAVAADLDRLLAAQKAESTVVVGQGMGGVVALMALAEHPERARGLVLVDVALVSPYQVPDQQRDDFLQFLDQNYDTFLRQTFLQMGRDSAQGVQIHAQAAQVPAATMKAYFRSILALDANQAIRKAKVPILALATERLWTANVDSLALATRQGYEGATTLTMRRVTDCGLLVASEQPDSLSAIIADFAGKVLARK